MSVKGKNIKKKSDFLRYLNNEMTERDRNAFERKLQQDPFAGEAMQGFENIPHDSVEKDLKTLKKRLKLRTSRPGRVAWYRVAASFAVLMIISSALFTLLRVKRPLEVAYSPVTEKLHEDQNPQVRTVPPVNTDESPALKGNQDTGKKAVTKAPATGNNAKADLKKVEPEPGKREIIQEESKSTGIKSLESQKREAVRISQALESANIKAEGLALKPALAKTTPGSLSVVRGKIVSAEDNLPLAGVSVVIKGSTKGTITDTSGNFKMEVADTAKEKLVASFIGMEPKEFRATEDSAREVKLEPSSMNLSEVVVVGYGTGGTERALNQNESDYTPPLPATGRAGFNKYIQENIRRPDTSTQGQRAVVVAGFIVRKDGSLDSMRIIRSPAAIFSGEALRLIREGPDWKPAVMRGNPVDEEVRVRIVFK